MNPSVELVRRASASPSEGSSAPILRKEDSKVKLVWKQFTVFVSQFLSWLAESANIFDNLKYASDSERAEELLSRTGPIGHYLDQAHTLSINIPSPSGDLVKDLESFRQLDDTLDVLDLTLFKRPDAAWDLSQHQIFSRLEKWEQQLAQSPELGAAWKTKRKLEKVMGLLRPFRAMTQEQFAFTRWEKGREAVTTLLDNQHSLSSLSEEELYHCAVNLVVATEFLDQVERAQKEELLGQLTEHGAWIEPPVGPRFFRGVTYTALEVTYDLDKPVAQARYALFRLFKALQSNLSE